MSKYGWPRVGTRNSLMNEAAHLMQNAGTALQQIKKLHTPCECDTEYEHDATCLECEKLYPCPTILILLDVY